MGCLVETVGIHSRGKFVSTHPREILPESVSNIMRRIMIFDGVISRSMSGSMGSLKFSKVDAVHSMYRKILTFRFTVRCIDNQGLHFAIPAYRDKILKSMVTNVTTSNH